MASYVSVNCNGIPNMLQGFSMIFGSSLTGQTGCSYSLLQFRSLWQSSLATRPAYTDQWIYSGSNPAGFNNSDLVADACPETCRDQYGMTAGACVP